MFKLTYIYLHKFRLYTLLLTLPLISPFFTDLAFSQTQTSKEPEHIEDDGILPLSIRNFKIPKFLGGGENPPEPESKQSKPAPKNQSLTTEPQEQTDLTDNNQTFSPSPLKRPVINKFDQQLPHTIYKKSYNSDNQHLPKARYIEEDVRLLFDSISVGDMSLARTLLKKLDNIEILNQEGNTLLIHAIMLGNIRAVIALLSMGANTNTPNNMGISPLQIAIHNNRPDIAHLLTNRSKLDQYENKLDPNLSDKSGNTPLMLATLQNQTNLIHMLIRNGANINKRNKDGNTALHIAVKNNLYNPALLLIKERANIEIRNYKSMTPFMLAAETGNEQIASILLKAGADTRKKDINGQDTINIALNNGFTNIAHLIKKENKERNKMSVRLSNILQKTTPPKPSYIDSRIPLPTSKPQKKFTITPTLKPLL